MIYLSPKTILGKLSVMLVIAFFVGFLIFQLLVALGMRGGETFFSNIPLAINWITIAVLGIISFFTGIVSIIKNKERSLLVFISTIIGFLVLYFVLGEILMPH